MSYSDTNCPQIWLEQKGGAAQDRGLVLPGYALYRAGRYGFVDAVPICDFEYDYAGLVGPVVHFEDVRAEFSAGAAPDTAFIIQVNQHR
jgi:hypothetical protein